MAQRTILPKPEGSGSKPDTRSPGPPQPGRKRRPHRKSRLGCSNCKLRSLKCDEYKPCCRRCMDDGFACTYSKKAPELDLQLADSGNGGGFIHVDLGPEVRPPNPRQRIPLASPKGGRLGGYELQMHDYGTLQRFIRRTLPGIGTPTCQAQVENWASMVGVKYPFITHTSLALSLMHDFYLQDIGRKEPVVQLRNNNTLAFHSYFGTLAFKQRLGAPNLARDERDALWITSTLLACASAANIESFDPLCSWPIAHHEGSTLDWITMLKGKGAVFKTVNPLESGSMFQDMGTDLAHHHVPSPEAASITDSFSLPQAMYNILGLTTSTNSVDNPYKYATVLLSRAYRDVHGEHNILALFPFISHMEARFRDLLVARDTRALLILSWYYAVAIKFDSWWLLRRCWLEGWATCIYLKQNTDRHDPTFRELLDWPVSVLRTLDDVYRIPLEPLFLAAGEGRELSIGSGDGIDT